MAGRGFLPEPDYGSLEQERVVQKFAFDIEFHVLQAAIEKLFALTVDQVLQRYASPDIVEFATADRFFLKIDVMDLDITFLEESYGLLGVFALFRAEYLDHTPRALNRSFINTILHYE